MSRIVFDDTMLTGIDGVDEQHETLIEIYNRLDDAYHAGRAHRDMREILARLFQYTRIHFETEEVLMARYGYEGYEDHYAQHCELVEQLRRFIIRFTRHEERISTEVLEFVSNWITHHIREADLDFARPVREAMAAERDAIGNEVPEPAGGQR